MNLKKRFELVKGGTAEIITEAELLKLLEKKDIKAYYGTAPTGPFHIAYLATISKIFDFSQAGIKTKILIADLHSALDDLKTPWREIYKRSEYYKKCIELAFPWKEKPKFVLGSDFQLGHEYMLDVLKIATISTITRTKRAASEVCRLREPKVGEMIYPIMQAVDEQYLDVDMQLGGIDQRHIMAFAREYLPRIDYRPRIEVMMPLIASLKGPGTKMSASVPESHIKIYESVEKIKEKITGAYCPEGSVKDNIIMQLCEFLIFKLKKKIKVARRAKYGGDITFNSYDELKEEFLAKKLHPSDLKNAVAEQLINIFKRARDYFEKHRDELEVLGKEFLT